MVDQEHNEIFDAFTSYLTVGYLLIFSNGYEIEIFTCLNKVRGSFMNYIIKPQLRCYGEGTLLTIQ
jgi:hypothetical protein